MATKLKIMRDVDLSGKWHNPPDEIITAADAYDSRFEADQMMAVSWWGDDQNPIPIGFSKFVFNNARSIRLLDTFHSQSAPIAPDDVVLFWGSRGKIIPFPSNG